MYASHLIKTNAGKLLWPGAAALLLFAVVLVSPPVAADQGKPEPTSVALSFTYLGNEGFLLESGNKKVLIDALQGDGVRSYVMLGRTRREILERALPPFGHVDLILATHYHRDHFDPGAVIRCLASNPSASFVSTEQAAGEVLGKALNPDSLRSRVHGFHPEVGQKVAVPLDGVGLAVMSLHHGVGSSAQNLGLIVELNGIRVLHAGDTQATPAEFLEYGIGSESFQVVFLPFWFLFEPEWSAAVAGAEQVVAMHVPALNAEAATFGPSGNLARLKKQLRATDPRVIVFDQVLERRSVSLPGARPGP